jgi:putative DNA primase/helicase
MTAAEVAAALGDPMREGHHWRCRCPLHGGHSLVLADGRNGRLLVRCWGGGCDARDVLAELRRRGLLSGCSDGTPPAPLPARSDKRPEAARRIEIARRIWDAARDARGSPVVHYLAGRGITLPPPPSLRWAPTLRRPDGAYASAVVARVDNIDGERIGVHRTWIERGPDGAWRRRDRAMLGRVAGGAVRLAPAGETLLIVEGIESALAAMELTGWPAWAALWAGGIERLALPTIVRNVAIAVDRDGAGERAAHAAAQRWLDDGRRVRLLVPDRLGADANDLLQEPRRAARPRRAGREGGRVDQRAAAPVDA